MSRPGRRALRVQMNFSSVGGWVFKCQLPAKRSHPGVCPYITSTPVCYIPSTLQSQCALDIFTPHGICFPLPSSRSVSRNLEWKAEADGDKSMRRQEDIDTKEVCHFERTLRDNYNTQMLWQCFPILHIHQG